MKYHSLYYVIFYVYNGRTFVDSVARVPIIAGGILFVQI